MGYIDRVNGTYRTLKRSQFVRSLPFWLPGAFLVLLAIYGAIAWNVIVSLSDFDGLTRPSYHPSDLDFEMYARALEDPTFWNSVTTTVIFMVVFAGLCLVVGLALSILLDQKLRFENTIRTSFLLPFSLSFVVTAQFWLWIYNPQDGVINSFFRLINIDFLAMNWLSPEFKLAAIVFALIWQFSGYAMIIYLAGLKQIPVAHYEAAKLDGATKFQTYRKVIIPQLKASTIIAAIVLMVFALKAFDFIFAMFGPNPGKSIDLLAIMMYREAFTKANWAYGAAIANVLFVTAMVVVVPYVYFQWKRGEF